MSSSLYNIYARSFQGMFRLVTPLLPWRKPEIIEGVGSLVKIPGVLSNLGLSSTLIVTDAGLMNLGLVDPLVQHLQEGGIKAFVFDRTVPNPTIENIEEALQMYHDNNCSSIIAFGGGSPMDCAKAVGARVAKPNKQIPQLKGQLKVLRKIPTLIAIPTTSGTGSEVTLAAVVSNSLTHEKYAINDTSLIPHYAVLDPSLTIKLPPHITSTTGMDALTHAVESYIGGSNTKETTQASLDAVKLIHENLFEAYTNPSNIDARANMQKASYFAGVAFSRAYVGYVHCVAHTLGGFYNVPHGLANAVILPHVLDQYGVAAEVKLSQLADHLSLTAKGESISNKAKAFIQLIKDMNLKMNIPTQIDGVLDKDIPAMVKRALAEGNPLYPVPQIWGEKEMEKIYRIIQK